MAVNSLSTLRRGLRVLEHIGRRQPAAASEMAAALDLDRSALQRVLVTLREERWIHYRSSDRRWELGPSAIVALSGGTFTSLQERGRSVLESLRDETGETAFLAIGRGDHVVVLDVVESAELVRIAPAVGLVIDADLSAAMVAIAAFLPREGAMELLGASSNAARLADELEITRSRGWSLQDEAVHAGITSIGAPVFEADGRPVAAVVVCWPSHRLPATDHTRIASIARLSAAGLSSSASD